MATRRLRFWQAALMLFAFSPVPSVADYDYGDSADFTLDLLSLDPGLVGDWSDSASFALDLTYMNRGHGDSSEFVFSDAPPPAPTPVTIETPIVVAPGEPFAVQVNMRNNGGPGDHGGISISFPDLTDIDESMPPYDSTTAGVEVHAETTFATVGFYDAGDTIDIGGTNGLAQHLLVEGDEDGWEYDEAQVLTLTVTSWEVGPLTIRMRMWIGALGAGYGPPTYRWPSQADSGWELDQQQYWAAEFCVDVNAAAVPYSVSFVGGADLHEGGVYGTGMKMGLVDLSDAEGSGRPWSLHRALKDRIVGGLEDEIAADFHSTTAAGVLIGNDPEGDHDGAMRWYQGMAPQATLVCEPATGFTSIDEKFQDLIDAGCEVVTIVMGDDPDVLAIVEVERGINDAVDTEQVTCVAATGDLISTPSLDGKIASPAQAYNVIAVGVTENLNGAGWWRTADENIPGPTSSIWGGSGRSKPDIVAPGGKFERITHLGIHDVDLQEGAGSSYSAPHVAGGALLLIEACRQTEAAGQNLTFVDQFGNVDPRAIKSALLTGADKTVEALVDPDDPQGATRSWETANAQQPLDFSLGAGGLDVLEALRVLLGESTSDAWGHVIGRDTVKDTIAWQPASTNGVTWDLGEITEPTQLTATLAWNAHYDGFLAGIELNNLDLYLTSNGVEVARSDSPIDNVEHIHELLDQPGTYSLEIRYIDQETDEVDPEPFAVSYRLVPTSFVDEPSDFDDDGDVDLADFSYFQECFGQSISGQPECRGADLDLDDNVGLGDFTLFQECMAGPDQPPTCGG